MGSPEVPIKGKTQSQQQEAAQDPTLEETREAVRRIEERLWNEIQELDETVAFNKRRGFASDS